MTHKEREEVLAVREEVEPAIQVVKGYLDTDYDHHVGVGAAPSGPPRE